MLPKRLHFRSAPTPSAITGAHGQGFTLTELLIAAALGVGIVLITGDALLSHLRSSARAETLQRQRDDWTRATSFIESEIAMSQNIQTSGSNLSVPQACSNFGVSSSNIKLVLDIDRELPQILYSVISRSALPSAQQSQWLGDWVLVRCGPDIGTGAAGNRTGSTSYDDYLPGSPVPSVVIDGLAKASCTSADGNVNDGFCVTPTTPGNVKSVSFVLALQGLGSNRSRAYTLAAGNHSRINPAAAYPEHLSICNKLCPNGNCDERNNIYIYQGSSARDAFNLNSTTQSIIVCGQGGGDVLTSGSGLQNVLDSGLDTTQGASLTGGSGKDLLYGSEGNDTIKGGANTDTLVGRCGADLLEGGTGTNHYLPWDQSCNPGSASTSITGGTGTDIVYLRGPRSDYTLSSCQLSSCTIRKGTATLNASNVEVYIFDDGRLDTRP